MARQTRRQVRAGLYRIWIKGQPRCVLFRDPEDYTVYLKTLADAKRRVHLTLYHYSLLRNEVHLLVGAPNKRALSFTLHKTHVIFRWHHRKKYHSHGRLLHDRFRHQAISPNSLLRTGQQIESLPVRLGLVRHPADYPYSSYAHYALGQTNAYLDANPEYLALAPSAYPRQEVYSGLLRADTGRPCSSHSIA